MNKNAILLALLSLTLIAAGFVYLRYLPDRYDITAPIDLNDKPTFVTELKIRLMSSDQCFAALDRAGLRVVRLPDEQKGRNCGFQNVGLLEQSKISWGGDITLKCPMLMGLAIWEHDTLQRVARDVFEQDVVRIRHYGTYSCRNINNASYGRRSEHAFANAVDISGFTLADGQEISIARDWGKKTDKGKFLRRIKNRACDRFHTVLGPEYNALHHDHFHFDNGQFDTCR